MSEPAALYVSCNPAEGPVSRFGARGVLIGASRSSKSPKVIDFRPDEVVEISSFEAERYTEEYRGAFDSGALIRRKREDFVAWLEQEAKEVEAAAEKAVAAAKAKAEEKAKAAAKAAGVAQPAPDAPQSQPTPPEQPATEPGSEPTESDQ